MIVAILIAALSFIDAKNLRTASSSKTISDVVCASVWSQCGGQLNGQPMAVQCCVSGSVCNKVDVGGYYYQCQPVPTSKTTTNPIQATKSLPSLSPTSKQPSVAPISVSTAPKQPSALPVSTFPTNKPVNPTFQSSIAPLLNPSVAPIAPIALSNAPTTVKRDTVTPTLVANQSPCTTTLWGQCGGQGFAQLLCCPLGSSCAQVDPSGSYFQCVPASPSTIATSLLPSSVSKSPRSSTPYSASTTTPVASPIATTPPATASLPSTQPAVVPQPAAPSAAGAFNYFSTKGAQIVNQATGVAVRITGITWMGFETVSHIVGGLSLRSYKDILNKMKLQNFNTIRITFSNDMLRAGVATAGINYGLNPDLRGLSPLQCMDKIISYCGVVDLRVILARYSAKAGNFMQEPYWYLSNDNSYSPQSFIADWAFLASRYAKTAVIGADLWNEPKDSAAWGGGNPANDWAAAATAAGNAILSSNADWLVIVEGTGTNTWWGGNLMGVAANPIVLSIPNKVLYSVHEFPQEYYNQPWFSDPRYPANLRPRWNSFWGYIMQGPNPAPVLVGAFGSNMVLDPSRTWINTLLKYMSGQFVTDGVSNLPAGAPGVSWCYANINPDGSIGGLLALDWSTLDSNKYSYIQPQLAPPLDSFPVNIQAMTAAPTAVPPDPAEHRVNCVTETFDDIKEVWQMKYFESKGCWNGLSTYKDASSNNGFLKMHIFNDSSLPYPCPIARIDSKKAYSNAYIETSFKLGGIGPDYSGLVYAFYTDSMNKNVTLHANEIDVEIVAFGDSARQWFPNSVQLGFWEPFHYFYQHFAHFGPYPLATEFVKYGIRWNNDTIDFFINGVPVYSSSLFDTSVGYTQAEKVIFSLWDGTPYPGFSAPINWKAAKIDNYRMDIDYVKICV